MFGFIKNLLRKTAAPQPAETESYGFEEPAAAAARSFPEPAPAPAYSPAPRFRAPPARKNLAGPNGRGIEVPLQRILEGLPLELHPRVRYPDVGDATISVPLEKILAQLGRGSVKVSFGELRQAAPDVFSAENDRDRVLVPLPLGEILARLNPALITRRRVQRQVEVPAEISSPFETESEGLVFGVGKPETAPPINTPPRHAGVPPVTALAPGRTPFTPPAAPPPPALPPAAPGRQTLTPAPAPVPPAAPSFDTVRGFGSAPRAPRDLQFGSPAADAAARPQPPVPAPVPAPPPAPAAAPTAEPLLLSLTALAESWPEAVRKEIVELNLVDARVALPASGVEQGLRQGRVAFSWKAIRSWIKPAILPTFSTQDGTVLDLPLKVVAPLFLDRQREGGKMQNRVAVDEDIPNLFFGSPAPATSSTVTPADSSDTNYYVWDDTADTVRVHESEVKRGSSPGTKFMAKYATPNEVVSRAAALDGVAGALIALPDGLMVANQLPAELNGDTLAAFLPQIFGKMSTCTKELRMGELNNLNFTVGNIPWKIFRVNAIFFAAFGRVGEPLPTASLSALAAELDHKAK
jgi:predicted regulator of Ras-like GTPase activity (Roadblock/LC7/MglB family)